MNSGSETPVNPAQPGNREEMMSALFAGMVSQVSSMALVFLGKLPNPQTGETGRDLEAARLFIDQLEMIDLKTRGNLSGEESRLLQETLTTLRLAFVEAVNEARAGTPASSAPPPAATGPATSGTSQPKTAPDVSSSPAAEELESKKRFSKKYGP